MHSSLYKAEMPAFPIDWGGSRPWTKPSIYAGWLNLVSGSYLSLDAMNGSTLFYVNSSGCLSLLKVLSKFCFPKSSYIHLVFDCMNIFSSHDRLPSIQLALSTLIAPLVWHWDRLNHDLKGVNWVLTHFNMFDKIILSYSSIWFLFQTIVWTLDKS